MALSAGVTTLITAGFEEPPWRMLRTLEAFEHLPVNVGLQPSARTGIPGQLEPAIEAGAVGLKIHEDWGAYPELIDEVLHAADAHDIQVCLHTDGLNESCELPETVEAIAGRAIHAYHVEGSGGGHIPDLIGIVREPNVFCSSTTPTIPYGPSTAAEQPDMKLVVHEGNPSVPGDVEAGPRAGPPRHDGGGGSPARPRCDLDRELRLAGHGPDRRDGATDLPARARDEGGDRDPERRTETTTTSGSSGTSRR